MYNFIKTLFKKKKKNYICSINFEINYDSTINIICHWPTFDSSNIHKMDQITSEYATLLASLNNGNLKQDILSTLNNLSNPNNINDNNFVELCLIKWSEYEKIKNYYNNEPLIRPSKVLKPYGIK